jgi:hypothetical protein
MKFNSGKHLYYTLIKICRKIGMFIILLLVNNTQTFLSLFEHTFSILECLAYGYKHISVELSCYIKEFCVLLLRDFFSFHRIITIHRARVSYLFFSLALLPCMKVKSIYITIIMVIIKREACRI